MAVDTSRIARIPLFAGLPADQQHAAAIRFEESHVDAGTHLTTEGGGGYFFFVIDEGAADVCHGDELLATFGPGDFFGEAAIFETMRRTATVTTLVPSTVLAMFGADFAELCEHIPELRRRIDKAIAERIPH
jgi:CRP-like cAMP-binding protein